MSDNHWEELQEQQLVGMMSVPETRALQELNDLFDAQRERMELEARLLESVGWRRRQMVTDIIAAHALPTDIGQYAVEPSTGRIMQTHALHADDVETPVSIRAKRAAAKVEETLPMDEKAPD